MSDIGKRPVKLIVWHIFCIFVVAYGAVLVLTAGLGWYVSMQSFVVQLLKKGPRTK